MAERIELIQGRRGHAGVILPVKAVRHHRKLRGGAQSHLIECDDGAFYVVKYGNNPQHKRILPNEWIACALLRYLKILVPDSAIVEVSAEFIREFPQAAIRTGSNAVAAEAGSHYGSKFPGRPDQIATYDFVPDQLLGRVHNRRDFLGALVLDKWTGNADSRQSVFFRALIKEWLPDTEANQPKTEFLTLMIDHGYIFGGPNWDFVNSPLQGLYTRKSVYDDVRGLDDFQPWLDRVLHFPEQVLHEAIRELPPEWLSGDEEQLERLLEQLLSRRRRVPDFVADSRLAKANPFANWPA